jgi:hypothetical protein
MRCSPAITTAKLWDHANMRICAFLCGTCESFASFAVKGFLLVFLLARPSLPGQITKIPPEVRYKHGYVSAKRKPPDFTSAMPWGIAITDTAMPGAQAAHLEIAQLQFSCRVDGEDVMLNDDEGAVRGGLYRRYPWFGTDVHDPMPLAYSADRRIVILKLEQRPDRVWHFWAASQRKTIPPGKLAGCTLTVRARISSGALLQVGFDYWKSPTLGYGRGGNNQEAGASDWYFPSNRWQDAVFTDIQP